jgi:hypothetical protein
MHIPKFIALVLIALSFSAAADFTTITEAYEVNSGDLRLPRNTGGTLTFKQCSECELQTLLVNSATRYIIDGRDVELTEFKERMAGVRNETVTVLHHLESNTITAIKVQF